MATPVTTDFPFPTLRPGESIDSAEAVRRLGYCLEWRPWLWRKPAKQLLLPIERFRGKRVLEIGGKSGRMSCLLAAAGGQVTAVDISADAIGRARAEAVRWGVADRIHFIAYDGDGRKLPPGPFDTIFTKSVLVMIYRDHLDTMLVELKRRLAPDGVGLFLENGTNRLVEWCRHSLLHRGDKSLPLRHWGFDRSHLKRVENVFGPLQTSLHYRLVWTIQTPDGAVTADPSK